MSLTKELVKIIEWWRGHKVEEKPPWPYCPICKGKMHEARAELPDDPGYHRPYGEPKRVVRVWQCACSTIPIFTGSTCASATFDTTAASGTWRPGSQAGSLPPWK